jgi:hypothetical protein
LQGYRSFPRDWLFRLNSALLRTVELLIKLFDYKSFELIDGAKHPDIREASHNLEDFLNLRLEV